MAKQQLMVVATIKITPMTTARLPIFDSAVSNTESWVDSSASPRPSNDIPRICQSYASIKLAASPPIITKTLSDYCNGYQ